MKKKTVNDVRKKEAKKKVAKKRGGIDNSCGDDPQKLSAVQAL